MKALFGLASKSLTTLGTGLAIVGAATVGSSLVGMVRNNNKNQNNLG